MRFLPTILFAITAASFPAGNLVAEQHDFRPRQVVPPFPVIEDAPTVVGVDAGEDVVSADELVLGLVIGDEARAYPIDQLTGPQREIINDDLGGRAIAATW